MSRIGSEYSEYLVLRTRYLYLYQYIIYVNNKLYAVLYRYPGTGLLEYSEYVLHIIANLVPSGTEPRLVNNEK